MFTLLVALLIAAPSSDALVAHWGIGVGSNGFEPTFSLDRGSIGFQISEALYPNIDKTLTLTHRVDLRIIVDKNYLSHLFWGFTLFETKGRAEEATAFALDGGGGCQLFSHVYCEVGLTWRLSGEVDGPYKFVCDRNNYYDSKYGVLAKFVIFL